MADFFRGNFFANTPGHPARVPAARRAAGFPHPAAAGRHAVAALRHLQRLRAVRERAGAGGERGVPRLREVSDPGARLERAGQPRRGHRAAEPDPPRASRRSSAWPTSASTRAATPRCCCYLKGAWGRDLLCAVTLDPREPVEAELHVPLERLGVGEDARFEVEDLLTGERRRWRGARQTRALRSRRAGGLHLAGGARRGRRGMSDESGWYQDAIIYQLHVRAFRDSDGDGIGDFAGLTEKLDYLQDLGVTAIWLLPFYPVAAQGRRLRHRRLHRRQPVVRHAPGLPDLPARGAPARTSGSSPSWCSTTPRTSTPGSSAPGGPGRARGRGTSTSGATPPTATPTRGSSSRTSSAPTGPGTRWPAPTTGTASTRTSPT